MDSNVTSSTTNLTSNHPELNPDLDFISTSLTKPLFVRDLHMSCICFHLQMSQCVFNEDVTQQSVSANKPGKGMYKCPRCRRGYVHKRSLRQHMRFECGKEPQFLCPYCPKKMKLKGNLKQHILLVHEGQLRKN